MCWGCSAPFYCQFAGGGLVGGLGVGEGLDEVGGQEDVVGVIQVGVGVDSCYCADEPAADVSEEVVVLGMGLGFGGEEIFP
ncbi:hypothetical protein BEI60_11270 [Eisenbergiella tayi]|nr:hypothetical protein BEI60_11270 [Eisenbergiella tayi]